MTNYCKDCLVAFGKLTKMEGTPCHNHPEYCATATMTVEEVVRFCQCKKEQAEKNLQILKTARKEEEKKKQEEKLLKDAGFVPSDLDSKLQGRRHPLPNSTASWAKDEIVSFGNKVQLSIYIYLDRNLSKITCSVYLNSIEQAIRFADWFHRQPGPYKLESRLLEIRELQEKLDEEISVVFDSMKKAAKRWR